MYVVQVVHPQDRCHAVLVHGLQFVKIFYFFSLKWSYIKLRLDLVTFTFDINGSHDGSL